jgi:hypothetical protein
MKKILLSLFATLSVLSTFAQTDWTVPSQKFDQYWIGGVRYGIAQFSGGISNGNFFSKLSKESKPSFSFNLGRQISPLFSVSASYSSSHYFSNGSFLWHPVATEKTNMSVTGKISEFGLYGTLNLNKLFSKNKDAGNNWNIYVTSGLGIASWTCDLLDTDHNKIVGRVRNSIDHDYTTNRFDSLTKIPFTSKITIPLTIGVNIQLIDGIWLSLEHSMRFVYSDAVDAVKSGYTDIYTTTTFGITANIQKLFSHQKKRDNVPATKYSTSLSTSQPKPTKTERRSVLRGSNKIKPELQEYTGYNALLPPPQPKADTSRKAKSLGVNGNKNIWVADADSGQLQITGAKKIINEGIPGTDIQTEGNLQIGTVPTYRIQIQASKTYISVEAVIKKLDLKEKVSVELRSDGWYRYYIGQFSLLPEAMTKLSEMRTKGIKDAFIVSFKTNTRKIIKN